MKKFLILLLLALPLLFACKEKKVTQADNGKTIYLEVNQILRVELPGNPSTGNDWRKTSYDDKVIIRKGKGNYMLGDGDPMIGQSGIYHFKFLAIHPGTTQLKMEYGSKYDYDKKALNEFILNIIVVDKQTVNDPA